MNDMTMMLAIHSAFHRDLRRIGAALEVATRQATTPARAQALAARWEWISEQIHHHHTGEDEWLWPALRDEVGHDLAACAALDAMEQEHRRLEPLQSRFDEALRLFGDRPEAHRAAEARERWTEFTTCFDDHIAHEERDAVPLLEQRLPAAALRRFTVRQQRTLGLRAALTQFFPWLLDGATTERQRHVLGELPAPLRLVVRRSRGAYARQVAPAWDGVSSPR